MLKQVIAIAGMVASSSAGAAVAQQPQDRQRPAQLESLLRCRGIPAVEDRVRCYDSAAAVLDAATSSGNVVVIDRDAISRTRRTLFGLSLPSLPFLGGNDGEEEASEIQSTVRGARSVEHGKWLVTLQDGAVWQTTEPNTRSRSPRTGDSITIRKGSLGSYRMSWEGSRAVKAKRIS